MDNKKYNDIMPEIVNITEENLKEYADQLQFDTLAQECIIEDLCKSYNISKDDMFLLIHELKNRGYNVVTKNTNAHLETEGIILPETSNITLVRNFGHESLVDDLNYEIIFIRDMAVLRTLRMSLIFIRINLKKMKEAGLPPSERQNPSLMKSWVLNAVT